MSSQPVAGPAARVFSILGGLLFAASLMYAAFAYLTAFGESPWPWSWAGGTRAAAIDLLLFTLFAAHHSLFARFGVKAWVTRLAPSIERSIYVWCASLLFMLLMWGWVQVPGTTWVATGPMALLLTGVQLAGVVMTGIASRHIGVLSLAGIAPQRPAHVNAAPSALKRDGLYGLVRHPIYFAWVLMVWPVPVMTGSRLVFAVLSTIYLMAAVPWEERSLRREFGPAYDDYSREVRWRMMPGVY
jgi:protein-S-isoprenylcysteine O-methyltransferase Ste14